MSPAYSASFENARVSLASLKAIPGHQFVVDDLDAGDLPVVKTSRETTDAHLVVLAKRYGMKLATLDQVLIASSWAAGLAENPLLLLGQ